MGFLDLPIKQVTIPTTRPMAIANNEIKIVTKKPSVSIGNADLKTLEKSNLIPLDKAAILLCFVEQNRRKFTVWL